MERALDPRLFKLRPLPEAAGVRTASDSASAAAR